MMNRKQTTIAVSLAVIAASGAYSAPKHTAGSHPLLPPFIGPADSITGACPTGRVKNVRVNLGNLLRNLYNQNNPRELKYDDGTDVGGLNSLPGTLRNTMLDMQLNKAGTHNDVVMVTVAITTTIGIAFLVPNGQEPDASTDGSLAVMIPKGSTGFCGQPTISHSVSRGRTTNSVTFGVLPDATYHTININLLIPDSSRTLWLPLIIDPNVKNDG